MEKIKLSYNPYNEKYTVFKDNEEISANDSWLYKKNQELELWISGFAERLFCYINDDISLTFKGYEYDYELLEKEIEMFNSSQKYGHINLIFNKLKSSDDRLEELKELFNYIQETSPFDDLREERVKMNFEKAMSSEFEVAVIGAMISGKSTLLNALLGMELMLSKNHAYTATIARIRDVDSMEGTSVICRDANENIVIDEVFNVTVENMSEFNDNEKVSYIDIKTDIPFVSSHNFGAVLIDTQGPNNLRDERHKEKIYKVINELNALILYVLNATQLGTIDDDLLLSLVSKAMEESGKQSRNRFMFVVNKVDYFDPDNGESLERALINVKDYLRYHGIENPNIYLASSETAKVIRLHKNRYELSRKQRQTYNELGLFLNEEEFHLEKYAPLSKLGRYKIGEALANAKSDEDIALIHTGIPAIEIAINEYLDKYVLTEKINQAVNIITEEINKIKSNIYDSTVNKYWLSDVINRLNNILEI